jgi:uroporphyrinogen-III synthase
MSAEAPRIVITRQEAQAQPWVRSLSAAGLSVLQLPLLRYASLPVEAAPDPDGFDWILFASPQGVRAFLDGGWSTGSARIGSLGPGTARTLLDAGLKDDLGLSAVDGAELARAFVDLAPGGETILLPGPLKRGTALADILTEAGYRVTRLDLYETLPVPAAMLPDNPILPGDLVFFCSPSAVKAFCLHWDDRPEAIAIGETTAKITRKEGFPTRVAETPDLDAMLRAAGLEEYTPTQSRENPS